MASQVDEPGPASMEPISNMSTDLKDAEKGLTIIAQYGKGSVYLVDHTGDIVHTWTSDQNTVGTAELLPNGTLIRCRSPVDDDERNGVHMLDWSGKVLWDYTPPYPYSCHHDIEPMPNGNILINVARPYSYDEMVALGRDPNITLDKTFVEPVFEPLGWDWKISMAVLASFPAREVMIATLGTIYNLGSDVDEGSSSLVAKMRQAKRDSGSRIGEKVFSPAVALSIVVFFALCCQCGATLVTIKNETTRWIYPVATFVYMTVLAYAMAAAAYNISVWSGLG